jgi:hypothetical protein
MKVAEVGELTTRGAGEGQGHSREDRPPRASTRKPGGDAVAVDLPSISNPTLRIAWERYRDGHMKNTDEAMGRSTTIGITSSGCWPIGLTSPFPNWATILPS